MFVASRSLPAILLLRLSNPARTDPETRIRAAIAEVEFEERWTGEVADDEDSEELEHDQNGGEQQEEDQKESEDELSEDLDIDLDVYSDGYESSDSSEFDMPRALKKEAWTWKFKMLFFDDIVDEQAAFPITLPSDEEFSKCCFLIDIHFGIKFLFIWQQIQVIAWMVDTAQWVLVYYGIYDHTKTNKYGEEVIKKSGIPISAGYAWLGYD